MFRKSMFYYLKAAIAAFFVSDVLALFLSV